jgi:hypothetical protein
MGTFFFYNNRKPRKFNYTPILYNPDEEARQERLAKRIEAIKKEMGVLPEQPEEKIQHRKDFKEVFISQTHHLKKRKLRAESGKSSFFANNRVLIIVLIILFAVFFFGFLRS